MTIYLTSGFDLLHAELQLLALQHLLYHPSWVLIQCKLTIWPPVSIDRLCDRYCPINSLQMLESTLPALQTHTAQYLFEKRVYWNALLTICHFYSPREVNWWTMYVFYIELKCTGIRVICLGSCSDGAVHVVTVIGDCQFDRDHVRDWACQ